MTAGVGGQVLFEKAVTGPAGGDDSPARYRCLPDVGVGFRSSPDYEDRFSDVLGPRGDEVGGFEDGGCEVGGDEVGGCEVGGDEVGDCEGVYVWGGGGAGVAASVRSTC